MHCKPLLELFKFVLWYHLLCFSMWWAIANHRPVCFKLHVVACTTMSLHVCAIVFVADDNHLFFWLDVDLTSARKVSKFSAPIWDQHWLIARKQQIVTWPSALVNMSSWSRQIRVLLLWAWRPVYTAYFKFELRGACYFFVILALIKVRSIILAHLFHNVLENRSIFSKWWRWKIYNLALDRGHLFVSKSAPLPAHWLFSGLHMCLSESHQIWFALLLSSRFVTYKLIFAQNRWVGWEQVNAWLTINHSLQNVFASLLHHECPSKLIAHFSVKSIISF